MAPGTADPRRAAALNKQGRDLIAKGDFAAAEQVLAEAVAADPKLAQAWNALGFAKMLQRKYEAAVADFDRALQLDPNYANAQQNRASAVRLLGGKR
jgi:lipoprotein NlpI